MSARKKFGVAAGICAVMVATAACGSSGGSAGSGSGKGSPIKIGAPFDETGDASPYGLSFYRSAKLLFNQVNKQGGINGHPLDVTYLDTQSSTATAALDTTKLIQQDGDKIIFGGIFTDVALAVANSVERAKDVLMYTPGSGADQLVSPLQPLIYVPAADHEVAAKSVTSLVESMKPKSIGFLEENDAFGQGNYAPIKADLEADGLKINTTVTIAADATDATSQLLKLSKSSVIINASTVAPTTALLKAEQQQGLSIPVVDNGGGSSPSVFSLVSASKNLSFYELTPDGCPLGASCMADFQKLWKASYGSTPIDYFAAEGYGTTLAFIDALKAAKSYTPQGIAAALNKLNYTNGILPVPVKFTASNHEGLSLEDLAGYHPGGIFFFGDDVAKNQYKP
jgi:branched-chain amino acid transport system substrate-binding protein